MVQQGGSVRGEHPGPYVIRDDALITSPRVDDRLVLNIDLAPTFADIAGISAPGAEGRSLVRCSRLCEIVEEGLPDGTP